MEKLFYWAQNKASLYLNLVWITKQQYGSDYPGLLTTPYYKYFGVNPDYCILFLLGAIGSFQCVCDGNHNKIEFDSKFQLAIDVGQNEFH